jgi:hypothetical protein
MGKKASYAVLCRAVPRCAALSHAVLCCDVLRSIADDEWGHGALDVSTCVLCHVGWNLMGWAGFSCVVLCCVVVCYAVLCWVVMCVWHATLSGQQGRVTYLRVQGGYKSSVPSDVVLKTLVDDRSPCFLQCGPIDKN